MQAYYLAAPFPIERAPTTRVPYGRKKGGVKVYELSKYPVRGLVFEMCNSMEDLSIAVANACIYLQNEDIPYNVLITDRGARVFLLPQCFAERQARGEVDPEILETQVSQPLKILTSPLFSNFYLKCKNYILIGY
jgi:GDP-L-galactose phosphorylase